MIFLFSDDVQLTGSTIRSEGLVELLISGRWMSLCSDNIDVAIGEVICHQLGYEYLGVIFNDGTLLFGRGRKEVYTMHTKIWSIYTRT